MNQGQTPAAMRRTVLDAVIAGRVWNSNGMFLIADPALMEFVRAHCEQVFSFYGTPVFGLPRDDEP